MIEPGRYRIPETQYQAASLTIEVPAGWTSLGNDLLSKDYGQGTEPGALLAVWPITGTFVDPCTDHTLVQPTPGPGIDALAEALANQPGTEAGPPPAVTVDGYPAKLVESTVTADIEPCGSGSGQSRAGRVSRDAQSRIAQPAVGDLERSPGHADAGTRADVPRSRG